MRFRSELVLSAVALLMACSEAGDGDPDQNETPRAGSGGSSAGGTSSSKAGSSTAGGTGSGGHANAGSAGSGSSAGTSTAGTASGGSSPGGAGEESGGSKGGGDFELPPANAGFDYQIGGGYAPPAGVTVVSRDRGDAPAAGLYNICYVNGFQAQQDDNDFWLTEHADLVLRDEQGEPVIDADWDEMLFDTSTAEKRESLAEVIGDWTKGCADDGFDAVEVDNLDSYSRSGGRLSKANNVAFMKLLSDAGHQAGLAMGQKNSTEILGSREAMGTDFAVAEECNRYDECGDYQETYGNLVFVIEYRDQDYAAGCKAFPELSIVRRDVDVSTPGSGSYVYEGC